MAILSIKLCVPHSNTTIHAILTNDYIMAHNSVIDKFSQAIDKALILNHAAFEKANTEIETESAYIHMDYSPELYEIEYEKAYSEEKETRKNHTTKQYVNVKNQNLYINPILYHDWDRTGCINKRDGVYNGPSGFETYYNLPMQGVVKIMRNMGFDEQNWPYWERNDGCKMLGDYIMVAADFDIRPRGSIVETSKGKGIVCDTGDFIYINHTQLDIAVTW